MSNACVRDKDVVSTADCSVDELSFHKNSEDHIQTLRTRLCEKLYMVLQSIRNLLREQLFRIVFTQSIYF